MQVRYLGGIKDADAMWRLDPAIASDINSQQLRANDTFGWGAFDGEELCGFVIYNYNLPGDTIIIERFVTKPKSGAGPWLAETLSARFTSRVRYGRKPVKQIYYRAPDGPGAMWDKMPVVKPEWVTDTVRALFANPHADTAIIADALQDAGCDDDGLLSDLREAGIGELVRQWVADTVTGSCEVTV